MEQKLELLEKEQQKLRQEVDSLHEIINILKTQVDNNCDIIETISISDKSSVSNEDGYLDEIKEMNDILIDRIESIIDSTFNNFKKFIIKYMREEISNKNTCCGAISKPDPFYPICIHEDTDYEDTDDEDTDDEDNK